MKYNKIKNNILLTEINQRELFALLKSQIECDLIFTNSEELIVYQLNLKQRKVVNKTQTVDVEFQDGKIMNIAYPTLFQYIKEGYEIGNLSIEIKQKVFQEKESLIAILDSIKSEFVESCVFIDYLKKYNMFSVIFKDLSNGFSDKLYYFEDNNSMLIFGKNGPTIIIEDSINSVEDVICN